MKKIILCGILAVCVGTGINACYQKETIEYHVTMSEGDTIWSICNQIATRDESTAKMVNETVARNHIDDCTKLKEGTELVIVVEKTPNFFENKVK